MRQLHTYEHGIGSGYIAKLLYRHWPAEPETMHEPGTPEEFEVWEVYLINTNTHEALDITECADDLLPMHKLEQEIAENHYR